MNFSHVRPTLFSLCALLAFASCEKPAATAPETPALTPEEIALNAILDNPEIFSELADDSEPVEFVLNTSNEVSILGYHKFADTPSRDDMVITTKKFRDQMQALKDAEIPVISMGDFLEWRAGKINIPDQCVIITMDDGWISVFSHALPILKEFGYPFSIYLYKNYINIGGRSLSYEQIAEIRRSGGEIGSHSVSHSDMNGKKSSLSAAAYEDWLNVELGDSKAFIKDKIGVDPTIFAYPYGKYNDQVVELLFKHGYVAGLTVNGAKVGFDTPMGKLGRFIIHGDNDINFKYATSFRGRGATVGSNLLASSESGDPGQSTPGTSDGEKSPLVTVFPKENSTITDRSPLISIDLSNLEDIDENSFAMRIAGLGSVTPKYDPETKTLSYQITQKLRSPDCQVSATLKRHGESSPDVIVWQFTIDRNALYLPDSAPISDPSPDPTSADRES